MSTNKSNPYNVKHNPICTTALTDLQQEYLFNLFSELHPYLKSYHLEYHGCPKTRLLHVGVALTFLDTINSSMLSELSDEFKKIWRLDSRYKDVFDKKPDEWWQYRCILRRGIPPIYLSLPRNVIETLFPDEINTFHIGGDIGCYEYNS